MISNIMFILEIVIIFLLLLILFITILNFAKQKKLGTTDTLPNGEVVFLRDEISRLDENLKNEFERNRNETSKTIINSNSNNVTTLLALQDSINNSIHNLNKSVVETLLNQEERLNTGIKALQESNEKKLEEMRVTVDEKLHSTLEKRLTSTFDVVAKQLEAVQKGLGQMQTIANDVGGLKRALTNVKTAGGIGEVQLEALLCEFLSPEQFIKNAHPNPDNNRNVVEFAVKIPSKTEDGKTILLAIDSKFPTALWESLVQAYEEADKNSIEEGKKNLITKIREMAKDIKEKYILPPFTTDFALMFLPFEGLFSEVVRIPGLFNQLQTEYKVTIVGPTTLGAFLGSLQMGFRTLTIQKETSRVWDLLSGVKTEFGKFGEVVEATRKKLETAAKEIDNIGVRSRAIEKKLNKMDELNDLKSLPQA